MKIFSKNSIFICDSSSKLSQIKIQEKVDRLSAELAKLKEIKISIFLNNSIEFIVLLLAIIKVNKTAVIYNTRLKPSAWKEQRKLLNSNIVFTDSLNDSVKYNLKSVGFNKVYTLDSFVNRDQLILVQNAEQSKKEDVVIFTSGSTGVGKGARLSLDNFLIHAEASNRLNSLEKGDCWLASLPFYHVGGLCILFRCLKAGASCFIIEKFSAEVICETLSNNPEITHVSLVPSVLKKLLENQDAIKRLKRLKLILVGGAPTDKRVLKKIIELELPVRTSYGMTETCSHISFLEQKLTEDNSHTSGKLLSGVEVDFNNRQELLVKSKSLFLGYVGEEARQEWFNTGDLAKIDSKGRLEILGRSDRTIISGGENINPLEIENLALQNMNIEKAVVVAIQDDKWGSVPALAIELGSNFSDFEMSSLELLFRDNLAKYKIPKFIKVIKEIPSTSLGKIDYAKVKMLF